MIKTKDWAGYLNFRISSLEPQKNLQILGIGYPKKNTLKCQYFRLLSACQDFLTAKKQSVGAWKAKGLKISPVPGRHFRKSWLFLSEFFVDNSLDWNFLVQEFELTAQNTYVMWGLFAFQTFKCSMEVRIYGKKKQCFRSRFIFSGSGSLPY